MPRWAEVDVHIGLDLLQAPHPAKQPTKKLATATYLTTTRPLQRVNLFVLTFWLVNLTLANLESSAYWKYFKSTWKKLSTPSHWPVSKLTCLRLSEKYEMCFFFISMLPNKKLWITCWYIWLGFEKSLRGGQKLSTLARDMSEKNREILCTRTTNTISFSWQIWKASPFKEQI